MKKKFALLGLGLLVLSAVILTVCAPAVPHSIEAHNDCMACHGLAGVKPYPQGHAKAERTNETCINCHHLEISTEK